MITFRKDGTRSKAPRKTKERTNPPNKSAISSNDKDDIMRKMLIDSCGPTKLFCRVGRKEPRWIIRPSPAKPPSRTRRRSTAPNARPAHRRGGDNCKEAGTEVEVKPRVRFTTGDGRRMLKDPTPIVPSNEEKYNRYDLGDTVFHVPQGSLCLI